MQYQGVRTRIKQHQGGHNERTRFAKEVAGIEQVPSICSLQQEGKDENIALICAKHVTETHPIFPVASKTATKNVAKNQVVM
jgi:hypothetical protein